MTVVCVSHLRAFDSKCGTRRLQRQQFAKIAISVTQSGNDSLTLEMAVADFSSMSIRTCRRLAWRRAHTSFVPALAAATPKHHRFGEQERASRFGREPALAFRLRLCTPGAIKRAEAREADWAAGDERICVSQCGPEPIEIGTSISRNSPIFAAKTHAAALSGAPIWGCQSRS